MELKYLKTKRVIFEIRYSPNFAINDNIWKIAERFNRGSTGFRRTSSNGIMVVNANEAVELTAEIERACYNAENVLDVSEAIGAGAHFLQDIVDNFGVSQVDRLGTRFYYILSEENKFEREHYAKLISRRTKLVEDSHFPSLDTAGFVVRFSENDRKVRFGVFSGDEGVVRKYHRYCEKREFLQPGIFFDIDLAKSGVKTGIIRRKGFRSKKFLIGEEIQEAHGQSMSLVQRYLTILGEEE